jgi:hypothetical protein
MNKRCSVLLAGTKFTVLPPHLIGPTKVRERLATVAPRLPVESGTPTLSQLRAGMQTEPRKVDRSLAGTFHPRRSTLGYTDVSVGRRACAAVPGTSRTSHLIDVVPRRFDIAAYNASSDSVALVA